jgi:ABC-2 type transport system ATP-binding protein
MTASTAVPAIAIRHLGKTYRKRNAEPVIAVDDLNLEVPGGQVLGFLGANGAGKTTTIKMMCGLVTPDHGDVHLNGCNVLHRRGQAMCQIGAVLEGTRNIYWRLSAWQNLLYYARLKGVGGKAVAQRARQLLTELELWERKDQPVGEFSRGMQQKVAIACSLIADPPIVLLDEPTLGLDVQAARTVKQWIRRLSAEEGKTVVLTTHQLDMAEELCDRVAIMRTGKLIADQPTAALLALFQGDHYQIQLDGALDVQRLNGLCSHLGGLKVLHANGHTTLSGPIVDQGQLMQVIGVLHGSGAPLLRVEKAEPTLEEVFVRLMEKEEEAR